MTDPVKTAEDMRREYEAEWGQYVAAGPIDVFGVRAYNLGDPVPASAVGQSVPEALVRKTTGKNSATAYEGSATVPSPEPPTPSPDTPGTTSTDPALAAGTTAQES